MTGPIGFGRRRVAVVSAASLPENHQDIYRPLWTPTTCSVLDPSAQNSHVHCQAVLEMDPLTAISLAGNIVQFVTFAASLISTTREVHSSVTGTANDVLVFENTSTDILDLSTKLGASEPVDEDNIVQRNSNFSNHIVAIQSLSKFCQNDCNKLLEILQQLKGRDGANGR